MPERPNTSTRRGDLFALAGRALCLPVILLALTAGAAAPAWVDTDSARLASLNRYRLGDDPDGTTTTTSAFDDGEEGIIPRPNSGHEPEDAGDRGGALQLGLLALIVVGVGVVGVKVLRQTQQVSR